MYSRDCIDYLLFRIFVCICIRFCDSQETLHVFVVFFLYQIDIYIALILYEKKHSHEFHM